jgi:iron-sulfur cluster insertion protein
MFSLTPAARHRLHDLLDSGQFLRIAIEGGGCSGLQYDFSIVDRQASDDHVWIEDGVQVVIDPISWHYLMTAELDHRSDLAGERFILKNPQAVTTCGCGQSFSV